VNLTKTLTRAGRGDPVDTGPDCGLGGGAVGPPSFQRHCHSDSVLTSRGGTQADGPRFEVREFLIGSAFDGHPETSAVCCRYVSLFDCPSFLWRNGPSAKKIEEQVSAAEESRPGKPELTAQP
jgi:hypothetical protein